MSYVKVNRSFHGPGRRPVRSRRVTKPKPKQEWVGTIHDLTVHKATPEELSRRHEIHQSKNQATVQREFKERAFKRRFRRSCLSSPAPFDYGQQRIMREYQLQDALAKSDQAIAVVKDLFDDAPRRQTGFPRVTLAPCCGHKSELPLVKRAKPLTQMSTLNQSAIDSKALNELDSDSEDEGSEHSPSPLNTYNFNRDTRLKQPLQQGPHFDEQGQKGRLSPDPQAPHSSCSSPCAVSDSQKAALNATVAVRRVRARTAHPESDSTSTLVSHVLNPNPAPTMKSDKKAKPSATSRREYVSRLNSSALTSLSGNQSSLEILQGMLGEVEEQLDSVAPSEAPESSGTRKGAPSLTGFSVSLVSSLGRLARQLRQCHEDVQKEVEDRKSLEVELREQRTLVDALTVESLSLREDNEALKKQLKEMDQRLSTLVLAVGALGDPDRLGTEEQLRPSNDCVCGSVTSNGDPPGREIHEQVQLSPAVLLSPPRQMDSQPHRTQAAQEQSLQYKDVTTRGRNTLALEVEGYDQFDTTCSVPSFASLPHLPYPWESRSVHTHCEKSLPDPHHDTVQNLQNFSQRRGVVPVPENKETQAASAITHHTAREPALSAFSTVTCMEERLLELNRQSVAARHKLLALIEQQREEAAGRASCAISPVPLVTSERRPGVAMSLPERELPVDTNWGNRYV